MRLLAIVFLAGASCAGGGDPAASRCDQACDRDEMCNLNPSSPFCDDGCESDSAALRPDFREVYFACYADLRCDVDGTECEVEASSEVERRTLDDQFQEACQTKHGECDESFTSDFCFQSHYFESDAVDLANDCLALTCDMIDACFRRELPFAPFDR